MKRGMGIIKGFFLLAGLWLLYMPLRAQAINLEVPILWWKAMNYPMKKLYRERISP